MKKPKPGVSPNPLVTGGKSMPKLSGPVGGMARNVPKAGMGGLLGGMGAKPRTTGTPKPPVRSVAKPAMVQPKPVIRSTAKPAMPSRKK